ncbi:DUF3299 domain-containing protein [Tropicimonas sp. TH_r6]|uniref:DUF3299 domain-containing protein n=1 Tax=Tropicimonas sp. TH_r6 TaxID=3082085 RepID=UPI0029542E49|nr:DUF3299 domain-containing protein [Tropicimonas sp. TH_r6]MDV7143849.1 DUF3299 domain-containing protein [Tropicimonas sp. TH_r6]
MKSFLAALAFVASALPTTLSAEHPVDWSDLVNAEAQVYGDPFLDLSDEQIDLLRSIIGARDNLSQGLVPEESLPEIRVQLKEAEDALVQDGLDADWLISQRWVVADKRKAAATEGNPALDGQSVSLAGYAIPAPLAEDGVPTAYLVEVAGMCSHTPPPLPNQLVRVRLDGDWSPAYMHQPVRLSGTLHIDPSEQVFRIVDGDVPMKATWRLDVEAAEGFMPKPDASAAGGGWAGQLRAQLTARTPSGN